MTSPINYTIISKIGEQLCLTILNTKITIYIDVDYSCVYADKPCECSDMCRCSTIVSYNITDVIVGVTRKEGVGKKAKTVKDVFLSNQVHDIIHPKVEELVDINIVNGYYGQEIYRTYHKDAITTYCT